MSEMISFREKMNRYSKDSLRAFANCLWIDKVSRLRKVDLIEKIADTFLNPENLFYRLSVLDDEAFNLLQSGSREVLKISVDNRLFDVACTLKEMEVADFDINNSFSTLTDVWNVYEKDIDHEKFNAYRAKASWVWKCIYWAEEMYGVTPEDIMLTLVNVKKKINITSEDLIEIFDHFPKDILNTLRLDDIYIDCIYLNNKDSLEELLMAQEGKDYYIPTSSEVEEYFRMLAILSKKPYQDMLKFLKRDIKMNHQEAEDLLVDLWFKLTSENDPQDAMEWFLDQFVFDSEAQFKKMIPIFTDLSNGTNLRVNRGYAPSDMPMPVFKPGHMPKIVPGSSTAARMLSEAKPEIQKMGFELDFDSNADTIPVFDMPHGINGPIQASQKKIYPNDPCPCGSGMKYKKCCGKK